MTARCGGGTSAPKLLPELAATYSAGRLAQLLVAAGVSELSAWLPLVAAIPVVYSAFCATDPPAMVALSQAESDAIANLTLGPDLTNGIGKFKDVLLNVIWDDACQCTTGSLTSPAIPARDPDTPVYKVPQPQLAAPCKTFTQFALPTDATHSEVATNQSIVGLDATAIRVRNVRAITAGAGDTAVIHAYTWGAGGVTNVIRVDDNTRGPSAPLDITIPVAVGAEGIQIQLQHSSGTGTSSNVVTVDIYCGGQLPGSTLSPCCPPDASTQAYLDLILKMVTLIQRQAVPFSYVYGTNHAGLSGNGTFTVSGLIGVSVDLTTIPSSYGVVAGSPTYYPDLGFVTLGTADGSERSRRLDFDGTLFLPPSAGLYTSVGYTFHPGIVASIRELVREP